MEEPKTPIAFDAQHAAAYDARNAKWAPVRAGLDLLLRQVLAELPAEARVLCVGAGTGAELLELARSFPGWRFTAVEPSGPMLEICRRRAEESGVAGRCTFHHGYLDSLPDPGPFDAATSILVSQFILEPEERRRFFSQIAARLRPGGCLVSADLAPGSSPATYGDLMEVWLRLHRFADASAEDVARLPDALRRGVALAAPEEIEALIASGGFGTPVRFFQALLIHAWFARRGR
jgi:tRNA (cmo5U34)-methyltransferase